jgi:hypothetical protein
MMDEKAPGAVIRAMAIVALYCGLTLAYAWPVLVNLGSTLPHDLGDPGLNAWIIWWNSQAVPLTQQWWNAPIFHPVPGAFSLSETMLSVALLTTPLQWLGTGPMAAYNIAFVASVPAAGVAAHLLVHRLTGRHDAALIAGLAFAFSPYRVAQFAHIQTLWPCWMPLCLLALHRYVETSQTRYLVYAALFWLLNGLTNGYFLMFFGVLTALWMLWFVRSPRHVIGIGSALTIGTLPIVPLLVGYITHHAALGLSRRSEEIHFFSADLSAIWSASRDLWLSRLWTLTPKPEGELYPGVLIVALTVVGGVVAWRQAGGRPWSRLQKILFGAAAVIALAATVSWATGGVQYSILGVTISLTRLPKALFAAVCFATIGVLLDGRVRVGWQRRSPAAFYTLGAVLTLIFALGPLGRVFGMPFFYEAPYSWLMKLPGGDSLRVPARFATPMIVCLSVAAGIAWARLVPRGKSVAIVLAATFVLADGWTFVVPAIPVPLAVTLGGIPNDTPVLELPMRDAYTDTAAMLRATHHRRPLINGFSGYAPAHYLPLQYALASGDGSVLSALQRGGRLAVVIDQAEDRDGVYAPLVEAVPGANRIYRTPIGPVYVLPALHGPERAPDLDVIPVRSVIDGTGRDVSPLIVDRNLETRWVSEKPQAAGDEVIVHLGSPADVERFEIDLATYTLDYPRHLRIAAALSDGTSRVVFEGRTAGLAVLGALANHQATTLEIDLDEAVEATTLILTLLDDDETFHWSIAELRVLGTLSGR